MGGVLFSLVVVEASEWCLCSLRGTIALVIPKGFVLSFGWNHLQHTRITVALACANFLLFFGSKTKENSHALKRHLYAYAANDSTLFV